MERPANGTPIECYAILMMPREIAPLFVRSQVAAQELFARPKMAALERPCSLYVSQSARTVLAPYFSHASAMGICHSPSRRNTLNAAMTGKTNGSASDKDAL
jgi:hypothetical protein